MAGADLFLHLPKVAVFDLVLIEAMSAGMPVVASPVEGNVEALGGDYPRLADHPESAAGKIQQLIKSPEEAAQVGTTLRKRAETVFSASSMAGRYLGISFRTKQPTIPESSLHFRMTDSVLTHALLQRMAVWPTTLLTAAIAPSASLPP